MLRSGGWLAPFAIAITLPGAVEAQAVVPLPGEEVRIIQRAERGAVQALFVEATSSEIVLRSAPGGGTFRVPRTNITGMSVQRGQRTQALKGALIGFGVGLVSGVILGQGDTFESTGVAVGVSVGAAIPLGLVIGWLVRSPEWDGVDMGALAPAPEPAWR
jgi:hypothetical protein